jgi:hypothetical protein
MSNISNKHSGVAALGIGIAFAGHLIRVWWLELYTGPVVEKNFYAVEDVMTIIDSPLWVVSGVLHLAVAAALSVLALSETNQAATARSERSAGAIAAVIGSGCFLLLGMTHLIGVPQIETLTEFCAGDGHTASVTYNLVRTVLLGSAFFALGWFLLLDAGSELRAGVGPKWIRIIGLFAGALCVLFVFSYAAVPLLSTTLMMVAVTLWGSAQAVTKLGIHSANQGEADV